jgi:hypothetical protein
MSASTRDQERMDALVREAMDKGSLVHLSQRTITIAGKRRHYLRVQSAIFTCLYGGELTRADEFLRPLVEESLRRRELARELAGG